MQSFRSAKQEADTDASLREQRQREIRLKMTRLAAVSTKQAQRLTGRPFRPAAAGAAGMTVGVRLDEAAWGLLHQAIDLYQDNPRAVAELAATGGPVGAAAADRHRRVRGDRVSRRAQRADGRGGRAGRAGGRGLHLVRGRGRAACHRLPGRAATAGVGSGEVGDRAAGGSGLDTGEVRDIVVRWPTRALRQITLIDTPAVGRRRAGPATGVGAGVARTRTRCCT